MLVVKTTSPATSPSPAKVQPEKEVPSSRTTNARLRPCLRPCPKPRSYPVVHQLASDHRAHDAPLELAPEIRAVRRPAREGVRPDRPLLGEIHERQVRGCARKDAVVVALDPASRGARHSLDQTRERKFTVKHKLRVE